MSSYVKPRGEMTPEELEKARAQDRAKNRARAYGKPFQITPEELSEARAIVVDCRARGMSFPAMEGVLGVSRHVMGDLAGGRKKTLDRTSYDAIMCLEYVPPPEGKRTGGRLPIIGSLRRLQALYIHGFTREFCAEYLGIHPSNMPSRLRTTIYPDMERKIREMYVKLRDADPLDFVRPWAVERSKARGVKNDWVPSVYWDDDTIDDPDGHPEWTGECGTPEGYYLHLKYDIHVREYARWGKTPTEKQKRRVLCRPCVDARNNQQKATGLSSVSIRGTDELGIAAALKRQETYRDIAEKFGVSTRTVQRIAIHLKENEGWRPSSRGPRKGES